jgi:hypothetical protein
MKESKYPINNVDELEENIDDAVDKFFKTKKKT